MTHIEARLANAGDGAEMTIAVTLHMSEAVAVSGPVMQTFIDGGTLVYTGGSETTAQIFSFPENGRHEHLDSGGHVGGPAKWRHPEQCARRGR
jgi:hypothetical protein